MSNRMFIKGALAHVPAPAIKDWDEPSIRTRPDGTQVVGRPTRGFGDAPFNYAGKEYMPTPWDLNDGMKQLKIEAEKLLTYTTGETHDFTFCLVGLYPEGTDSIPHHSDTVPTWGDWVVSISFGAPRVFSWRTYKEDVKKETNTSDIDLTLLTYDEDLYLMEHGDTFIFNGLSQMNSTHAVPPVFGAGERVNFTFRTGL